MVRAALLVAILVTGMMGHSRVEQTLASSASLSLIFPPASAFLLSAAVAGGKTALTEQSDPQQGFVRSYAYNIAGGADAFGDSYTVNVSTSHADALVASHKDRSQDQPGIANYRVEGSGTADAWAYVDSRGDAVLARAVVENLSFMVVRYGPQGSQDWTTASMWTPIARRAVGVLAALVKRAKTYPPLTVQERDSAFLPFASQLPAAASPCVQAFNHFLSFYESYQHGSTTMGQVADSLPSVDATCVAAQSRVEHLAGNIPDVLRLYPSVVKAGADWQMAVSAYREALTAIGAVVDDGVALADSYVSRYATAAVNYVVNASATTNHIKQSWHLH